MNLSQRIDSTVRNVPDFPKPGIQFKDITPILEDSHLSEQIVDTFADQWKGKIDAIAGVESRGFLFGFPVAMKLGLPFILIRKKGKLPYETVSYKYDLEYGSAEIEMHVNTVKENMRILIHDDLLATGGTATAAAELIKKENGKIAGFSFLIELEFLNGRNLLNKYSDDIKCLMQY